MIVDYPIKVLCQLKYGQDEWAIRTIVNIKNYMETKAVTQLVPIEERERIEKAALIKSICANVIALEALDFLREEKGY